MLYQQQNIHCGEALFAKSLVSHEHRTPELSDFSISSTEPPQDSLEQQHLRLLSKIAAC